MVFSEYFILKKFFWDIVDELRVDEFEFFFDDDFMWYFYFMVIKGFFNINKVKIIFGWEFMIWESVFDLFFLFLEGVMIEEKFVKEREMLLVDFFESIVFEEYYLIVLKKLIEIYGNDVMEGIVLDIGFDIVFEIEGLIDV